MLHVLQAGFDALYFGRIDYQDRAKRIADADMEMVWRASRSLEDRAQIFTGTAHLSHYGVGFTTVVSHKLCSLLSG